MCWCADPSVVFTEFDGPRSKGSTLGERFADLLREEKAVGGSAATTGVGWSQVRIGSSVLRGGFTTSTAILASGLTLVAASVGPDDALLVDADLYGARGRRLGTFRQNRSVSAQPEAELAATVHHVLIRNAATGHVILNLSRDDKALVVTGMDLWTRDGKHCELDTDGVLMTSTTRQAAPTRSNSRVLTVPLAHLDLFTWPFD
jgi:hypothetical protein